MAKESYLDTAMSRITDAVCMEEEGTVTERVLDVVREEILRSFRNGLKAANRPPREKVAQ